MDLAAFKGTGLGADIQHWDECRLARGRKTKVCDPGSLGELIRDASDPMVVMRRVVDQALVLIPSADGAVVELADDGHLTYVCAGGTLAPYVGTRLPLRTSLSGLSVRTGETLYCEDARTDPRVDLAACRTVGAMSMICVPLHRGGRTVGVLKVSSGRPLAFSGEDLAKLAGLAEFISIAIAAVSDIARIVNRGEGSGGGGVDQFVANVLRPGLVEDVSVRQRIEHALAQSSFLMHYQPLVSLESGQVVGAEALARFPGPPRQTPDLWFAEAQAVGLSVQLQIAAARKALAGIETLPPEAFLAINVGPDVFGSRALAELLDQTNPDRIVLELTEHLKIDDYPDLRSALARIRRRGVRLAIDDTGAGFASLGNIVNLAPDLIKLDRQFTTGIDIDPVRRALAQALISFAQDTGAEVVAEGIETAAEFDTVRQLGIAYGQGYFIARPAPYPEIPKHLSQVRHRVHG